MMRKISLIVAYVSIMASCGPQCLYWWDTTGKNRGDRAAELDTKACHIDQTDHIEDEEAFQNAMDKFQDCMSRHGWKLSDHNCPANER